MDNNDILQIVTEKLELSNLTKTEQESILSALGDTVMQKIILLCLEKLPEERHRELLDAADSGDADRVRYVLKKYIPNFDEMISHEIKKIISDFKRKRALLTK